MKRISFAALCNLFVLCFSLSCQQLHHNTNIQVSESGNYYILSAQYDPDATKSLENYMTAKIGRTSNMSFANTRMKGQLTLDDNTTFYIQKYPGYLEIKLDKRKNSYASYQRMKQMCEGIKKAITQ
jgi:hypothetical protein